MPRGQYDRAASKAAKAAAAKAVAIQMDFPLGNPMVVIEIEFDSAAALLLRVPDIATAATGFGGTATRMQLKNIPDTFDLKQAIKVGG